MSAPANTIAWDFQAASSPLASKVGQAETFVATGSPTVSPTNGAELDGSGKYLTLTCTNGGHLTDWPTNGTALLLWGRSLGTGANGFDPLFGRFTAGGTPQVSVNLRAPYNDGDGYVGSYNWGNYPQFATSGDPFDFIDIVQYKAAGSGSDGVNFFQNGSNVWNNHSQTIAAITQGTTDIIRIGISRSDSYIYGFAVLPAWDSADLGSLNTPTNIRAYLGLTGGGANPIPAIKAAHRRRYF